MASPQLLSQNLESRPAGQFQPAEEKIQRPSRQFPTSIENRTFASGDSEFRAFPKETAHRVGWDLAR